MTSESEYSDSTTDAAGVNHSPVSASNLCRRDCDLSILVGRDDRDPLVVLPDPVRIQFDEYFSQAIRRLKFRSSRLEAPAFA